LPKLVEEEEESVQSKILRGKPTRCRLAPLRVGGGATFPRILLRRRMDYTPTLRVSAKVLDLEAAPPPPGFPVLVTERGVSSPGNPALTNAARRFGVGAGPD
jgi:hypothetical protein